jgi:hypothetical protein
MTLKQKVEKEIEKIKNFTPFYIKDMGAFNMSQKEKDIAVSYLQWVLDEIEKQEQEDRETITKAWNEIKKDFPVSS